ncbi:MULTISPECIES: secA translation cis-regulator SecM [Erwinia]|uniref:Secretion monitor n=2 Tax=Erwinia TaxID=551 RepID=A0A014NPT3_9GAMM|nr:secA translation cis-regulator SecM [Erwinia mallotivora]EXU75825.1 Secretion monitor [Erwinia mallotivora]
MIGILNRWRQFGRRYFWPHLLLGMVAASLGLPYVAGGDQPTLADTHSRSLNISFGVHVDRLALLQESVRRQNPVVDYWHQHAIRTVIRHLSFSLTPANQPTTEQSTPLEVQKLALLDTLNALLTHEERPPAIIRQTEPHQLAIKPVWQTGLWLAQVEGIRAGPACLLS